MARADSTTPSTKRPRKSPAERAQLDLDAAVKRRDQAQKKYDKLAGAVEPAKQELKQATALVDYLSKNPLLPQGQDDPTPETEGTNAVA